MDISIAALLVSILLASIFWYTKSLSRLAGKTPPLPPGPRGIPVLGYLPFLRSDILQQFGDLARQYGPIYKLRLGSKLTVVINSPSLVKQVVRDQDPIFADRDATVAVLSLSRGANDIAFSPQNSSWRLMRKVLVREMQSNRRLEASYELRKGEVRNAIRHVYSKIGEPVKVGQLAFVTELNLVLNLLWGGKIGGEEGEKLGAEFRAMIAEVNDLLGKPNVSDYFPVLSRFDLQGIKRKMEKTMKSLDEIMDKVIAEHERLAGGVKNEGKEDFVQILLELKEKADVDMSNITKNQIKAVLIVSLQVSCILS